MNGDVTSSSNTLTWNENDVLFFRWSGSYWDYICGSTAGIASDKVDKTVSSTANGTTINIDNSTGYDLALFGSQQNATTASILLDATTGMLDLTATGSLNLSADDAITLSSNTNVSLNSAADVDIITDGGISATSAGPIEVAGNDVLEMQADDAILIASSDIVTISATNSIILDANDYAIANPSAFLAALGLTSASGVSF